eukprot:5681176-Lingulodinium_polyedra.AAC.1
MPEPPAMGPPAGGAKAVRSCAGGAASGKAGAASAEATATSRASCSALEVSFWASACSFRCRLQSRMPSRRAWPSALHSLLAQARLRRSPW